MGTTTDSIRSGNLRLGFSLCIEGYDWIIGTGTASEIADAWSGTQWSKALSGLMISGSWGQKIEPWSNELSVSAMTFAVMDTDGSDQFGIDMFRAKSPARTELTSPFSTEDSDGGSFNIGVRDATGFSVSDTIHIGTEAFDISAVGTITLTVAANGEGVLAPFNSGTSSRFPRPHSVREESNAGADTTNRANWVGNKPTNWIGKQVALYSHAIRSGVWDTVGQAQLDFAGLITGVSETADGHTAIQVSDMRELVKRAELFSDQWVGEIESGIELVEGDTFWISFVGVVYTIPVTEQYFDAAPFVVGTDIAAGVYTAAEIGVELTSLLNADSTIGRNGDAGSGRDIYWNVGLYESTEGLRFRFEGQISAEIPCGLRVAFSRPEIAEFLGYKALAIDDEGRTIVSDGVKGKTKYPSSISRDAPYWASPINVAQGGRSPTLHISSSSGRFIDGTANLPEDAARRVGSGEVWSFFLYAERTIFFGKVDSATNPTKISDIWIPPLLSSDGRSIFEALAAGNGIREGETADLSIRQVVIWTDTVANMLAMLFSSLDGKGINGSYDVSPFGGAGIPWSLLGTAFVDSCEGLEQGAAEDSMTMVLERPIKLWDAIKADLGLRMATVVWKDEGFQIAQFSVPNAGSAEWEISEATKSDEARTKPEITDRWQCTTLKIKYNRDLGTDDYTRTRIVRDFLSAEQLGGLGATKTLEARNAYGLSVSSGSNVNALADLLAARFLPVLARPVKLWRTTVPHTMWGMAPGDQVSFSDSFVRDPTTGVRGVASRGATVLEVNWSYGLHGQGGYFGDVVLLYTEEDRSGFPLAPSAESYNGYTGGSYSSGWDATNSRILVQKHAFSLSTGDTDASYFQSGSAVVIREIDPDDPTSLDEFTDILASVPIIDAAPGYDALELTTGFGGGGNPAYSSSKTYIIEFNTYSDCLATDRDKSFQSDAGDGLIQDLIEANAYGEALIKSGEAPDLSLLPVRHSEAQWGDGKAYSADLVRSLVRAANNLANYKCSGHTPFMDPNFTGIIANPSTGTYRVLWVFPYMIGRGAFPRIGKRVIKVAPFIQSSIGGTAATLRVTSSDAPPSNKTFEDATFSGNKASVTFSTTAGSPGEVVAAQDLPIVRSVLDPEITWITVEGADNGSAAVKFYGLSEFRISEFS